MRLNPSKQTLQHSPRWEKLPGQRADVATRLTSLKYVSDAANVALIHRPNWGEREAGEDRRFAGSDLSFEGFVTNSLL